MQEIQNALLTAFSSVLVVIIGYLTVQVKNYLKSKTTKEDFATMETIASIVVRAVEQKAYRTGADGVSKHDKAIEAVRAGLENAGLSYTKGQLEDLVEAAVNKMNESWKG